MKSTRLAKLRNSKNKQNDKKKKFDIVVHLLPEVAQPILFELKPNVIWQAWNTNERWKPLMRDEFFWKMKYQRDDLENPKGTFQSKRCKKFLAKFNQWQGEYFYNQALTFNWKNKKYGRISLLKDKGFSIYFGKLIYFDDEISIVNFSHTNTSLINTLTGAIEKVFCFNELVNDRMQLCFSRKSEDFLYLFYGTADEMLKVQAWNLKSKEIYFRRDLGINRKLVIEPIAYRNAIGVIDYLNNFIYYSSPSQLTPITVPHVRFVNLFENMAVLEMTDGTLQIMNMNNGVLTPIRCCNRQDVRKTAIMEKYIVSLCIHGHLSTWDLTDYTKFTRFPILLQELYWDIYRPFQSYFLFDGNKMAYLKADMKSVAIRDIFSGKILVDIKDNKDEISSFTRNNRFIFTFCDKNTLIKMWCSNTGQYIRNFGKYSLPCIYPKVTDTKIVIPYCKKQLNAIDLVVYDFEAKIKIPRKSYL